MSKRIRVMIADDHAIVRQGLRQILSDTDDMEVAGEACNGVEALQLSRDGEWDVVLMDVSMPDRNGIDALKLIKKEQPRLPVLILSMYPEDQYAIRALKAGAAGYLTKQSAPDQLVTAIRQVASGKKYVSATLAMELADAIGEANRAIIKASNEDLRLHGMGSTVVLASFAGSVLTIGHVGDSRAYLFRRGALERMTVDHSLLQELVDGGMISAAEARRAPGRGVLTRSLGVDPKVEAVVASFPVAPGDLLLLCSDGLTEMVPDAELCEELSRGDDDLGEMTARLIECANRNGGRDNVSVVLVAF